MFNFVPDGRCPPLPVVPHSSPSDLQADQGTIVIYICDRGYRQTAPLSTQCKPNLEWSLGQDKCIRKAGLIKNT